VSWNPKWEAIHKSRDWGTWPSEDLALFLRKHGAHLKKDRRVPEAVDLGCGTGANTRFIASHGYKVLGIDASQTALDKAMLITPGSPIHKNRGAGVTLYINSKIEDIQSKQKRFDLIVDVCSLQHGTFRDAKIASWMVHDNLRHGGYFYTMLVASESWRQPLRESGMFTLYTLPMVKSLMKPFHQVEINWSERSMLNGTKRYRHWVAWGKR